MIPVTFSPPGTAYVPSPEDALRDGVLLMLKADDVTREAYSFDVNDATKGVRIFSGLFAATEGGPKSRKLVLPQLLVTSPFAAGRWSYDVSGGGEKKIAIIITDLQPQDSSELDPDTDAPEVTAETRFARIERVLMFGTLTSNGQDSQAGKVIDLYRSPLLIDGTYDPAGIKYLNGLAPDLSRQVSVVGDVAVAYSLIALYTVDVADREIMTSGGFE